MLEFAHSDKQALEPPPANTPVDLFNQAHSSGGSIDNNRTILDSAVHFVVGTVWHDEQSSARKSFENGISQFSTAVPLFMAGTRSYFLSGALYAINQAKLGDSTSNQLEDLGLGALKGLATKATFDYIGSKANWNFAAKGVTMGALSRAWDVGLNRQTYLDANSKTDILGGLATVASTSFNPWALGTDIAVFGAAHFTFKGLDARLDGKLSQSPLLGTAFTGSTFGFTSGALGEIQRERQDNEGFDPIKVLANAGKQSLIMGSAAAAGFKLTDMSHLPQVVRNIQLPQLPTAPHSGATAGEGSRVDSWLSTISLDTAAPSSGINKNVIGDPTSMLASGSSINAERAHSLPPDSGLEHPANHTAAENSTERTSSDGLRAEHPPVVLTARDAARSNLTTSLSEGLPNAAKELIDLKLLTADDLETAEIRAAARSGLAIRLSQGRTGTAKQLIDLKLLTHEDLETAEIRAAARSGLTTSLSIGNIYEVKELIDLKLLTHEDLKTAEIRDAARSGLTTSLSQGRTGTAKQLVDLKLLTADDLKTAEIRDAARSNLTTSLSIENIYEVKELIDLKLLTANEIRDAVRPGLAALLWQGRTGTAKQIIDLKLLTADDLKTAEIRDAARSALAIRLSQGLPKAAEELIDLKLLTHEDLKTAEIRDAARSGLAIRLSQGRTGTAKQLVDLKLLTADDLKTAEIRDAARSNLTTNLSEGRTGTAKQLIDLKLLTANEIRDAVRPGLATSLSIGNIYEAKQIIDLKLLTADDLKTAEIRDAARSGLAIRLSEGLPNAAKQIIDLKLLTADDLKTAEIRDAARSGLTTSLSQGRTGTAKQLIDLKLLTADDLKTAEIRDAARSGLTTSLSQGRTGTAKQLIDLKLLTADDLKTAEIRDAARSGLTTSLSQGKTGAAKQLIDLTLLDHNAIDDCLKQSAQAGYMTDVVRTALSNGTELNTALKRYLDVSKLTDENATKLFEDLKKRDSVWDNVENIQRPFEDGATIFGASRMLRYVFKANATPHDALFAFHDIVQLYHRSGLSKDGFYGNVLSQVNRDNAVDDAGSSFTRLNAIARGFPDNIDTVLQKTERYPEIKKLQELAASLPNAETVFASWPNLQRFTKLQQFVDRAELLPELQQLRLDKKHKKLADWIETLAFHTDSRVAGKAVLDFWKEPESFLDHGEIHSPTSHNLKKPSHYTDIPHLDLNAVQLRDALVDGTLDRLQVFSPMQVEYEVGGSNPNLASELKRALGSREHNQASEAKNVGKLFSKVNTLLKANNFKLDQVLSGAELPSELQQHLETVLYDKQFGAVRPPTGLRLIAGIHRKSDPLSVVAGDDTASCMGFGTGKNNVYMFNPNDALFTVRLVREDGTSRTIAQTVLTKDKDVKVLFPTILEKMQGNEKATLHTIFPPEALRGEKAVIAADNVQVHPNYQSGAYPAALQAVYRDFFGRYAKLHGNDENIRDDKLVIGLGYSTTMTSLPKEPNTFVPQAPVGYTDKSHAQVLTLSLTEPQTIPVRVLNVKDNKVKNRTNPQASIVPGITPLTFEDTLPLAYLEGKIFQDSPSLRVGLHNMENALIAKDINNAAKTRPNLSLKYADRDGKMKGYLLAYEGKQTVNGAEQPVVYIGDYASDGRIGPDGARVLSFVGGKLLLEFGKLYKENYLDKGEMIPIFTNARDQTSYSLLMRQIKALGDKFGYRFDVQELGSHQADSSTMHDVLIVPHRIPPGAPRQMPAR